MRKYKSLQDRLKDLKRLRIGIECFEDQICEALYKDLGKGRSEAYMTEIGSVYASISYAEKHLKEWIRPEKRKTPFYLLPATSQVRYEAYGNVLIIGPFNYPFRLIMVPLIGAICAGNDAVVKPSEIATHTEKVIAEIVAEAFTNGNVQCVTGGAETTEKLINSGFDYIFFTGSANVGRKILEAAAETLTPVTLELGGKSPVIVCNDADIKLAAKRIMWGKTINAGQTCIAPDYVLADKTISDELIIEMERACQEFFGENAALSDDYSRIINERHFKRIQEMLNADKDYIVIGGASDIRDLYIEPTILDLGECENALPCATMQEEIFGPVLPIISYDSLGQIWELMSSGKGVLGNPLALYIFTEDAAKQEQLLEGIPSGGVCINDTILHITGEYLPFGGVGASGMGAYQGKESFLTFSHKRSIMARSNILAHDIMYPPYRGGKLAMIKKLLR
ncbi:MAG: aldehyde dehydrogenase family protein [Eubacteriales bacterium]|nr:aldehyde dehydrogenase family protein [Eubacteriales bacterium]MDD4390452.1 aldehyde dehydrogenase family protein [Eubacteriales bacterium]